MSWLPRLCIIGTTICELDDEFEGWTLQILWRAFVLEFTFGKRSEQP